TDVVVVAGALGDARGLPPPPDSWASQADSDLAIFTVRMQAGARWTLARAQHAQTQRQLYVFAGQGIDIEGHALANRHVARLNAHMDCVLQNGEQDTEFLMLQARPIGEPVAQYGPFVMNTQAEIHQAFADYRRTEFGGWPWPSSDPVHPREAGRFAKHADGRVEHADTTSGAHP
ncbi:MAG: pirin-like C-terminal cupin domain-containing protein, partial [Limnohabitans sp.]